MMVNDPRYSDAVTANAVVDNRHITMNIHYCTYNTVF